jgi:hypothetical protein
MKHALAVALMVVMGCKDKAPEPKVGPAESAPPPVTKADEPKPAAPAPAPPAAPAPAAGGEWTTYTSKEGKYTIEFPTKPKEQGAMVMSEFGATDADSRTSGCGMASVPSPNKAADPATVLNAMTAGYKANAKVLEEKDITINGAPGKHLVIENEKHRKWIRVYLINDRIYINNCGGPFDRGDKDAPTAKRVLESFKPTA